MRALRGSEEMNDGGAMSKHVDGNGNDFVGWMVVCFKRSALPD